MFIDFLRICKKIVRQTKHVTQRLGIKFIKNSIQMEITLRCNAKCAHCSRHCNMFEFGKSDMTIEQINKFIHQVKCSKQVLNQIDIMGGEPLLHPNFETIVRLIYSALVKTGYVKRLRISTNGLIPMPEAIKEMPIEIVVSPPNEKRHRAQLVAPKDTGQKIKYCFVPYEFGMALNYFGYSPCGAGGAIARLFRYNQFIKHDLPNNPEHFQEFRKTICPLCQVAAVSPLLLEKYPNILPSLSVKKAIDEYIKNPPTYRPF